MKFLRTLPLALLLAPLSHAPLSQAQDTSPNTLFIHGNILTGAHLRAGDPSATPARVTALAVTNSTIVAVGSDEALLKLRGPHTQVVDLHGSFVMPGFNDAHTHITEAGQQKLAVDLDGTTSLDDMLARIKAYVATAKPGQWIQGGGWDHTKWASKTLPTRADLDKVTGDHPAVFYRTDGHIVVANSAALAAANITGATPAPDGGKIDLDANGSPTGIVRETPAVTLIVSKIPPPDPETRRKAIDLAIADCLAHGVTSVQNSFSAWDDWLALEAMEKDNRLNLRIAMWMDFNLPLATLKSRRASHDPNDPLLHLTQLKGFMDGSLGSRTASLAEPYADDESNSGIPRYQQARLNEMASSRAAAGFQLGFHAIGDEANHMALNAFEAAEQVALPANAPPPRPDADSGIVSQSAPAFTAKDLRFRIEHAQVLLPEDFDRYQKLGVIASMQPSHLLSDINWAGARLGPERSKYAYAWRSMLDHHIPLAFGTDYPVEAISPFRGLYAAVTRKNEAGTLSFHPEQKLTIQEALYAYTQGSAYGEFRETVKGRLETGFLADFIVLDHDLLSATPEEILHTQVLRTVVGGKTVYTAP
jgi:predicted amidohydrolase YtcJ